jgi:signal peptidase I
MNSTEEQTAAELRAMVEQSAPATVAPPGLARLVLDLSKRQHRTRISRAATALGVATVAGIVAAASLTGSGDYRDWTQPSGAMTPTVGISQVVTLNKTLTPQRGDVVALNADDGTGRTFELLSRVIGLPGDTVECPATTDGSCEAVIVSGERLDEPWIVTSTPPFPRTAVPEDRVFLLGDARDAARDSRFIGPQRLDSVFGVAVARATGSGPRQSIPGTPEHDIPERGDPVAPADPVPPSS